MIPRFLLLIMTISVLGACTQKTNITPYSPTNSKEELVSKLLADLPEMTNTQKLISFCECKNEGGFDDPAFIASSEFFNPSIIWEGAKNVGFRKVSNSYSEKHKEICLIELSDGEFFELELEQFENGQWFISEHGFRNIYLSSLQIGRQSPEDLISEVIDILENEHDLKEVVQFSSLCMEAPDRINWGTLGDSLKVDLWEEARLVNINEFSESYGKLSGSAISIIELSDGTQVQLGLGEIPLSKNWILVFEESWYTNNHSSHYGKKRNY